MRYTLSEKIGHILRVIIAWFGAYLFLGFIRFYGMISPEVATQSIWSSAPRVYISQILLASIITGILYGLVDIILDRPRYQRASFWRLILTRGSLHFVIILITLSAVVLSRVRFDFMLPDDVPATLGGLIRSHSFQVFAVYFLVVSSLMNTYQQVNQKFGRGVLLDMMRGKFHKPQEAVRIFMFIDLKSSVRIAEELGHLRYSALLQDCYFDLNTQLDRYKARIYQYVGDQVVLHWTPENGLMDNNCLRFFFAFIERMESRGAHYVNRYGFQPYFKAAAHIGRVTIAEVGVLKRSIAFHGDTVNTTSRLHDQCNSYSQRLLVSKDLLSRLPDESKLKIVYLGDEVLKGKYRKMEIYGVKGIIEETNTSSAKVGRTP